MEGATVGQVRMRPMTPADAEIVLGIYRQGIATGDATFETEVPAWEEWDRTHLVHSRIVAEMDSRVVGWAALSPVSDRCVYGGVAEVSVYVASGARGKGIGLALLDALVTSSESEGIWTLQAGLFPENVASVRIQERMGFRVVGVRERLGQLAGVWRDVLLMERRSQVQGR
jgi:phosphinothricin acetyltransferase